MGKKISGIALIILGSIPIIMQALRMFGGRPNMPNPGAGGLDGGLLPSGMPPSGMPPGGGPPGEGILLGILGTLGPYLIVIAVIFIALGVVLLTHKERSGKNTH